MTKVLSLAAVALSIAVVAAAASPDEQAIRASYARYDAAWNKGDAGAVAELWAPNAQHMEPDGRTVSGRTAIAQELARRLMTDLKDTHSTQTIESIQMITPTVALVDASYEVSGMRAADGSTLPPLRGRYADIWLKRSGRWQVVADRPIAITKAGQ